MKPSEFVAAMADDLQTNGWIQDYLQTEKGSCLLGAMVNVTQEDMENRGPVSREVQYALHHEVAKRGFDTIPHFNDVEGRTLKEVLDFLHDCQVGLKEKE